MHRVIHGYVLSITNKELRAIETAAAGNFVTGMYADCNSMVQFNSCSPSNILLVSEKIIGFRIKAVLRPTHG